VFVAIGAVLSEESFREREVFSIFQLTIQYVYWVVLALFIKTWIYEYDFYKLSRVILVAAIVSVVYYLFFNRFYSIYAPNAFAYVIVTVMPLGFYYVMQRFSLPVAMLIGAWFVVGVLFSESRTGLVLTIVELLLLFGLSSRRMKEVALGFTALLIPLMVLFAVSYDEAKMDSAKYALADMIEDYSPKIAHTLRMKENILERDKSWLIRELMLQKGERIFEEHPFFGVGVGNFMYYSASLDIRGVSHWLHEDEENYNQRSSQNSYLMILAEDGIFALVSIMIVFIMIVWRGFYYVRTFRESAEIYVYVPFVTLLFYGVVLVTVQGSLFWVVLGFALTLIQRKKQLS
jgi:O-antigen ligase